MAISLTRTLWMAMANPGLVYVLHEFPLEKRDFHRRISPCQAAQRKHCPMNDRPQIAGTQPSWTTRMCGWCHEVPLLNLMAPCYRDAALDSASAVLAPDHQVISVSKCCQVLITSLETFHIHNIEFCIHTSAGGIKSISSNLAMRQISLLWAQHTQTQFICMYFVSINAYPCSIT